MTDDQFEREVLDRLNDQNRVLQEARMLPKNRPLTAEEIDGVRGAFAAYAKAHADVKLSRVAREINYSAPVVSDWASGKYKGDVQTVSHAVNDWMERDARRSQSRRPKDYVSTWVAETMRTIAHTADKRCLMAAIVAPAGCGKSMVLKTLAEEMRGVYLYCDPDMSAREFLLSLAMELNFRASKGTKAALKRHIVQELAGTHRIIFLDEAHQLRRNIGSVRSIFDQARVPIVMAGTADILTYVNDRTDGRGQFSSRCIRFNVLDEVRNAEGTGGGGRSAATGRDLFSVEEVKAFFAMKRIRLSTDALRLMWRLACLPNQGTLRLVENVAEVAIDLNPDADVLSREHVMEALSILMNADAAYLRRLADRMDDAPAVEKARVA